MDIIELVQDNIENLVLDPNVGGSKSISSEEELDGDDGDDDSSCSKFDGVVGF